MTYVMSDIHGEMDRYHRILDEINFKSDDTLYIIGDVIDRGPCGVEILEEIMGKPNIIMLLGNHEAMCLAAMKPIKNLNAVQIWMNNGGNTTSRVLYQRTGMQRHRILKYLKSLPDCLNIDVNGQAFHLVHACPGADRETRIWNRPSPDMKPVYPDKTVIIGHTPVMHFHPVPMSYLTKAKKHMTIFHGKSFIGIDCGCGLPRHIPKTCLACLCLDTMQEFYV